MFLTAWGDDFVVSVTGGAPVLLFLLVQLDFLIGHSLGLACRPTDLLIALFCWSLLSGDSNPGWGDWRRSLLLVWACCGFCFGPWAIFKSVCFAFHATGLDAVQRLEQKKS